MIARGSRAMGHVFLSYRRSDSADICGRIYDRLQQTFGRDQIFKDVDAIPGGIDFRQAIYHAIAESQVFVVIIGPDWVGQVNDSYRIADTTDLCRLEVEYAFARHISILPLLVRNATMPDIGAIAPSLKELQYQNARVVRGDPDFHIDMERVIRDLQRFIPLQPAKAEGGGAFYQAPQIRSAPQGNPYFLNPQESDRPFIGWSRPVSGYVYRWKPYLIGLSLGFPSFFIDSYLVLGFVGSSGGVHAGNAIWALFFGVLMIIGLVISYSNRRKLPITWR